jgi:hypothetical protein
MGGTHSMRSKNRNLFTILQGSSTCRWNDGLIWKWAVGKMQKAFDLLLVICCEHSKDVWLQLIVENELTNLECKLDLTY